MSKGGGHDQERDAGRHELGARGNGQGTGGSASTGAVAVHMPSLYVLNARPLSYIRELQINLASIRADKCQSRLHKVS